MPRHLRIHLPGGCYHVTLRGNHRQDIFSVDSDRLLLNAIVEAGLQKYSVQVHAYCWMTNHLHFLAQIGNEPLGHFVRHVAAGYARAYQRRLETTGHLFERRYHAVLVDTDSYLLELVRYIHFNPLRSGLVPAVHQYRWSCHHAYTGAPVDRWVTTGFALGLFSPDKTRAINLYREFVACDPRAIPSPLDEIRGDNPWVLGNDDFIARLSAGSESKATRAAIDALIDEASQRFRLSRDLLRAGGRNPRIALARAWVATKARERRLANLSSIARIFGCDPKALRHAMQRFSRELKESG